MADFRQRMADFRVNIEVLPIGVRGIKMILMPTSIAGVAAGRMPEFIEMMQVGRGHKSGSARLRGR